MNRLHPQKGSALIEFSLVVTVMLLLALGVFDFGLAIQQGIQVSAAAHAGAEYGATEGNSNDIVGMQNAAAAAAPGISNFSSIASTWCTCSVTSGVTVNCTTTLCNTYDLPIQYVQVQTTANVPILFRFTGLPLSIPLGGVSTLRAK
jgi:Flp pilus assembly protein TadG